MAGASGDALETRYPNLVLFVTPVDAGIHDTAISRSRDLWVPWIPTFVGMTKVGRRDDEGGASG